MQYRARKLSQISFPLGGIGSGCIGLAGNGALHEFEIFGRPNKLGRMGYSGFAVKAESDGQVLDARVLQSPLAPPYAGQPVRGGPLHSGFGFGPAQQSLAGFAHFQDAVFTGTFPLARIDFIDDAFPVSVSLSACNPFIPMNADDSSLPAACFEITMKNITDRPLTSAVCLFLGSPFPAGTGCHTPLTANGMQGVHLGTFDTSLPPERRGDLAIATDCVSAAVQPHWYRGGWCDPVEVFWREFTTPGPLKSRRYAQPADAFPGLNTDTACLEARAELPPGGCETLRFVVTWHFPVTYNHWNPEPDGQKTYWQHHYAALFHDAADCAAYTLRHWRRLWDTTVAFRDALFSSTLPEAVLDAVSANLSVLKSPTVLRLTDGSFYGFEGCIEDVGCCEGSCSHVWNYAYAPAFLFPSLARRMRELDYTYNQREDGRMAFRLMLPLGRARPDFSACVDGQMGGVIQTYRDWKFCGDDEWLRRLWPKVKLCLAYAWSPTNEDRWDPGQTGVISGRQHHTLDMELYGPNSWLEGFYLAALRAAAEMADALGEPDTADHCRQLYRRGMAWTDEHLWNGRYYQQQVDLTDARLLVPFDALSPLTGETVSNSYWNAEAGQLKYQIADGCAVDQVIADWHTGLCGLPPVFDREKVKVALRSLFKHNFLTMSRMTNTWRLFALNDEQGLVVCTWPDGAQKPVIPLTYASECMTGFEYQAACHMLREGLTAQGLDIVRAIRDRYDGEKRNPWNEMECGSNYARSMASYALLPTLSGFTFDLRAGVLGFRPTVYPAPFRCFWSVGEAWGTVFVDAAHVAFTVLYGHVTLRAFDLPTDADATAVTLSGHRLEASQAGTRLRFGAPVCMDVGAVLVICF